MELGLSQPWAHISSLFSWVVPFACQASGLVAKLDMHMQVEEAEPCCQHSPAQPD